MSNQALIDILLQSSRAMAVYAGPNLEIQMVNAPMLKIWELENVSPGAKLEEVLPILIGQPLLATLKAVWTTGQSYAAKEVAVEFVKGDVSVISYYDFHCDPVKDAWGNVYCALHTAVDVTAVVKANEGIRLREEREQLLNEELNVANEELRAMNDELGALNEEYISTNEQLDEFNQKVSLLNQRLEEKNFSLISENSDYQDTNEQLSEFNAGLEQRNDALQQLNDSIVHLNNRLANSESGFRNLIEQAPISILLVKGEEFTVSMINAPMLELVGRDARIIGRPLFEMIPELQGQDAANKLIDTYRDGQPRSESATPVSLMRNGKLEHGYFNFNYAPYYEDGKITGVIDMAIDVTAQVLAIKEHENTIREKTVLENTLRNSEQRLQGILETMAEGVGIVDLKGRMVYANPMAQQILGLTLSDIEERTYDDPAWQNIRLDGSLLPNEEHPMSIMMSSRRPVFDHEIGVLPSDRDPIYISINAAPIFDAEGNLTGGIGTFMDVTTRRLITQGKDDFISIASHELKSPVTTLKAALQVLERSHDKLPAESRSKLINQSIRSIDKLSGLINDLLDAERIAQGQLILHKKTFSLLDMFDDCCAPYVGNTEQEIILEAGPDLIVKADDQQIGQVLLNFITNAVKYAPDSKKIIIAAHQINENEIKISVTDSGPGIPEEKLAHLFKRYYRTDYQGQKFTGLGLGLYISAEIIKNHGGRIGAESVLGKGSEFWFTIPLITA